MIVDAVRALHLYHAPATVKDKVDANAAYARRKSEAMSRTACDLSRKLTFAQKLTLSLRH